jgi:hypothetical protein
MSAVRTGVINSLVTSLVVCGLLALAGPYVMPGQEVPDASFFVKVFAVCALALIAYELFFTRKPST